MTNLFDIKDSVVVITGGTGILGKYIAAYLAQNGAKVVAMALDISNADEIVEFAGKDIAGELHFIQTDVLNKEKLEKDREEILAKYGRIDVLLNAAGGNMAAATIPPDKTFLDLGLDAFRKVVDLNLIGTLIPTMVFAEQMAKQKSGSIVNFSSESALRPLTRVVGYGCAKAAVSNLTKFLATEMAQKFSSNIRVNALVPGFFLTEQNRTLLTNEDGSYTERAESILSHTPSNRFGNPDDLLGAIHYLISDASRFVTGAEIVVDGGFDAFSI